MKTFIVGFALGLIVLPLVLYCYFSLGFAPVATGAPEMPFEKQLARLARRSRIRREMPKMAPVSADEPNLLVGAGIYRQQCALCHGLPSQDPTATAKGMFPKPPQLFRGKGVTDNAPGETYWKAANGIRLSGMPGFSTSLSETQLWQVSLLLANANRLPLSVRSRLTTNPSELP